MKKILVLSLIVLLAFDCNAQSITEFLVNNKEFVDKIILAIIGAILGITTTYILTRRKERIETKQLTYDLSIDDVTIKADKAIKGNIEIKYKGNITDNLSFVNLNVKNTGKKLIKDQFVRIEFDKNTQILDYFFSPEPQPELGVEIQNTISEKISFERKIKIKHLEKEQNVNINFIVSGKNNEPKFYPHNELGEVEFNNRKLTKIKADQAILREFILINFALLLILPFVIAFSQSIIISIYGFTLLISNIFYLKSIPKILSELIFNKSNDEKPKIFKSSLDGNYNILVSSDITAPLTINFANPINEKNADNINQ